jgi:hypothetical protein
MKGAAGNALSYQKRYFENRRSSKRRVAVLVFIENIVKLDVKRSMR